MTYGQRAKADQVPLSRLTPDFLRGVYLAGTYSVLAIGWSIATCLSQAVILTNSKQDCYKALCCPTMNISTQVILHSICYMTGGGGPDLHQYMFVHGPMSAPVLLLALAGTYLCRPTKSMGPAEDEQKSK